MALIRSLEDSRVKNLKSLSYGANKPLVTKDINKNPSPQGIGLEASRRVDDLVRITKFFASPSGAKYLGNEALLQQIGLSENIKKAKASGKTTGGAILQQLGKTALTTGKLVASTLAQVPVNGTGTHFFRGFIDESSFYTADNPTALLGQSTFDTEETVTTESRTSTLEDFRDGTRTYNFKKDDKDGYQRVEIKRETRVNLGDQSKRVNISDYTSPLEEDTVDKLNMLPPIKLQNNRAEIGTGIGRDFIKFRFEVITPEQETILYFRAYLDTLLDTFNGDWSKNNYLGRGEAFYTYGGFDRSIQLGFKAAAATRHEMKPLYQKLTFLASATAPTYSANFMRGTLVKVTVGDYINQMPGVLESVSYNWNQDYPWEIAFQNPEGDTDDDMQELPHILEAQVNFRPIHEFTPRTGLYHYITSNKTKNKPFFTQNQQPIDSSRITNSAQNIKNILDE